MMCVVVPCMRAFGSELHRIFKRLRSLEPSRLHLERQPQPNPEFGDYGAEGRRAGGRGDGRFREFADARWFRKRAQLDRMREIRPRTGVARCEGRSATQISLRLIE